MNRYFSTLLTLLLFVGALQSQSFEGTVELKITKVQTQEVSTMIWYEQDINSRLDVTTVSPQMTYEMSLIMQDGSDKITMLMDVNGKKSAYTSAVSEVKSKDEPIVNVTDEEVQNGTPEERNGFACEVLTVKGENGMVKYWLTSDIDIELEAFPPLLRQANYYQYLLANNPNVIPVSIHSYNAKGELEYTQDIEKVTEQNVDGAVFQVSSEYEQVGN